MSNKKLPRVTSLMALFNFEDYIEESLLSVVNQDYPKDRHQVAVIDDCSTDRSISKVVNMFEDHTMYGNSDHNLICGKINGVDVTLILLRENGLQGRARNYGIRHFYDQTDLFTIADADDIQHSNKYSTLVNKYLEDTESIGIVYADYFIKNLTDGSLTYEYKKPYSKSLLMQECIVHSNCLFTKASLDKVGFFFEDESPCEDFGLWLRISDHFMVTHVAQPLTTVQLTGKNSAVAHSSESHNRAFQNMIKNYQEYQKTGVGPR
jgi:glycosyltransferase involved in cell wall biosynthesis